MIIEDYDDYCYYSNTNACQVGTLLRMALVNLLFPVVLGSMAFFIAVFGIEKIPWYPVLHGILVVN